MRFLPLVSSLAVACAAPDLEGACKGFVTAANACNQEHAAAKGNDPVLLEEELCESDTSDASNDQIQAGVDRYDCKADAFANADCSTDDGFEAATAAAAACDAA